MTINEARTARGIPVPEMLPHPYRVERVRHETRDIFTLELAPADGETGFRFRPGQFNMLYVFGAGEVPISISGDPATPSSLVHTTRTVGAVTRAMRRVGRGQILGVRGPFGTGWPVEEAEGSDVLIIAGGIGLAPLRPAVYRILAAREKYGKVALVYGTRTPADIPFRRELERWRSRFDLDVYVTVDRASGGWKGNVGVITTLIPKVQFDPTQAIAMVCGPEIMMRFTALELERRGMKASEIFLSLERNMKCGIGFCGHCQFGPTFVCKDGPVFPYSAVRDLLTRREI